MKRVKIMLMSLMLLAIVGGALAFKAKFSTQLCYTTEYVENSKTTCTLKNGFTDQGSPRRWLYTTTPVGAQGSCSYKDANQVDQPITCFTTSTTITED